MILDRRIRTVVVGLLIVSLFLTLPLVLLDKERMLLDETVRARVEGEFVATTQGTIHYQLEGPADRERFA